MGFCTFDDAHAFLMEAKGLPTIPSASLRLRLCLRTCIALSWVGLEEGLDGQIEAWGTGGKTVKALPIRLKLRMLAFLLPLHEPALLNAEFDRLYKIRSQLARPRMKENSPHLTLDDAEQTFEFCLKLMQAVYACGTPVNRSLEPGRRLAQTLTVAREQHKIPPARERALPAVSRKSAAR